MERLGARELHERLADVLARGAAAQDASRALAHELLRIHRSITPAIEESRALREAGRKRRARAGRCPGPPAG